MRAKKHTLGRWTIERNGGITSVPDRRHASTEEVTIARVAAGPHREADAHLIATAPELLAFCKMLLKDISMHLKSINTPTELSTEVLMASTLYAVVAKAEGRGPKEGGK